MCRKSVIFVFLVIPVVLSQSEFPYVIAFIIKHKYPAAAVCSGVIITEKHVLSAAYPIALMSRRFYCALPGYADLGKASFNEIENNCIDYEMIHLIKDWKPTESALNLAVVILKQNIRFTWSVSTARIPYPESLDTFSYNTSCVMGEWSYRKAIDTPGLPFKDIAVQLLPRKVLLSPDENHVWTEENAKDFYICTPHFGLPIMCDCNVIGIFISDRFTGNVDCYSGEYSGYTPILSTLVQDFLNETIPLSFIPLEKDYI